MKTSEVLRGIRARLNRAVGWQALAWSLSVSGGVLLAGGLACVLRGFPVMAWCWLAGAAAGVLCFATLYLLRRQSQDDAARFADRYFGLKDTLTSDLHFQREGRHGEFFDLIREQAELTAERISRQPIGLPTPRRLMVLGTVFLLAGFSLSFRSPSPEVIKRWQQEAETKQKTAEINEALKLQMEELSRVLGNDSDLISPEELKKWMQELRQTKDLKEAMRQYAMLERRIAEADQRLHRRDQEELARQAGEALQQDPSNRQLGQQLASKQFAEAAKQLAAMQPQGDGANPEAQRQQMEKLRSAAQRMGQVAKEALQRGMSSGSDPQQSPNTLAQNMAALDDATRKLDEALRQAQQQSRQNPGDRQQSQSQCKSCSSQCQSQLDKLCNKLNQMSQCRNQSQCLSKLSQCLSQCQSYMNGQCRSLGQKNGGKKAGQGTAESRRDEREPLPFTTETMQLQGQKGQGPSDKITEAADSGDRTGARRAGARERTYQKQAESFVHREDVPAEVKEGVKNYFKTIQDRPETPPKPEPQNQAPPKPEAKPSGPKKAVG